MDNETDITQSFEPVEPPPPPGAPPGPPPAAVPPPPGQPPPRFLLQDVWPWLVVLLVVVVGGLLVWLLVLRSHTAKPVVPGVVGMQQSAAIEQLTRDGYSVKAFVGPGAKPLGVVASQVPGGGSQLPKGAVVRINVSNGHRLGVTTTPAKTTATATTSAATTTQAAGVPVPDVVGQDMASGAGQIEAAGLVAETDPLSSSTDPAGQIVQETPGAGAQASAGDTVALQVSTGTSQPPQKVPSVVGQKAGTARASIIRAKLTVRTVYRKGPAKDAGVVVSQAPSGGGTSPAYTQVTLTVGQ